MGRHVSVEYAGSFVYPVSVAARESFKGKADSISHEPNQRVSCKAMGLQLNADILSLDTESVAGHIFVYQSR